MAAKKSKHLLIGVASLLLGLVAGCVGALVTWQFWGWFENTTGIESLGHSGPADWVFCFMIGIAVLAIFFLLEFRFREKPGTSIRPPEA